MTGKRLQLASLLLAVALCSLSAVSQAKAQSIGPFEIVSADSTSRVRVQFAGQQLVTWQESEDHGVWSSPDLTTELRRIRLGLRGRFNQDRTSFYLHLSLAPRSLELMDFLIDHRVRPGSHIRAGQYKVPFTRFRIQSFQRLTFVDWPIVTRYFGAERQIGVSIHNGYESPPRWGYVAGLFTGVNARASHGIGIPIAYGEKILNPSDLSNPGPKSDVHPEAFLHLSYHTEGMKVDSDTDPERGSLRILTALSIAWDFDPTAHQDFTQRAAAEMLAKWNGWSANAVGYAGFARIEYNEVNKLAMLGALVQTAYRINPSWEASARYAIVDYSDDLRTDIVCYTARSDATSRQHEATVGINRYIIGHSFKWQNDAGLIRSDYSCCGHQTLYRVRSQLQIAF